MNFRRCPARRDATHDDIDNHNPYLQQVLKMLLTQYPELSTHALSPQEKALLARASMEEGPSAADRATALWDPDMTLLAFSLQFAGQGTERRLVEMQRYLLRRAHERGTLRADIAAQVPGVTTAEGACGTVLHLAVAINSWEMIGDAVGPYGVNPSRCRPSLGRTRRCAGA